MSASQEKATRRDLRRILGVEAEGALRRQSELVGFTSEAVRHQQAALQAHDLDIGELKLSDQDLAYRVHLCEDLQDRDLRGRLRWLLLGK